jgi:hypothetical protein
MLFMMILSSKVGRYLPRPVNWGVRPPSISFMDIRSTDEWRRILLIIPYMRYSGCRRLMKGECFET